ncbi:MAG: hypothetical protein ACRCSN_10670 [Dermatophilaceae bacterium]
MTVRVHGIVDESNLRHTTSGPAHDLRIALNGRLSHEQAEQHLRGEHWPYQNEWPLTFAPPVRNTPYTVVVLGWVPDSRRDEALAALDQALIDLQTP